MENTLENKAKLFAQYWGQEFVRTSDKGRPLKELGKSIIMNYENADKFQAVCFSNQRAVYLKPISSITVEHSFKVAEIFDLDENQIEETNLPEWIEALFEEESGYYIDGYRGDQLLEAIDFLRGEGYALKWRNLSVGVQVEYGWVKLSN